MSDDYANARCCAIMRNGKRCRGGWASAEPVTFAWDPIKGVGTNGPYAVLCGRHRRVRARKRPQRIRVVHGWLGGYNQYDYGSAVFRGPELTEWRPSAWWWARRQPCRFGERGRTDAA